MRVSTSSFAVDSEGDGTRLLETVAARYRTHRAPPSRSNLTYFDTFDWRLLRKGLTFTAGSDGDARPLCLSSGDGAPPHRLRPRAVPVFAGDFPTGAFRDALSDLIDMRRLLPLVEVELHRQTLCILDSEDKTVVRITLEHGTARAPGSRGPKKPIPPMLRIDPVRGYRSAVSDLVRFAEQQPQLRRRDCEALELALTAMGRRTNDYSSELKLELQPQLRSDEAMRRILRSLLRTLRANEQGTRESLDMEFLHDFRVAVRRTRSCLGQIEDVLAPEPTKRFSGAFKWLSRITSPTRDLDVYLLKLPDYTQEVSAEARPDLEPLAGMLRERRQREQQQLAAALESERYRRLRRDWQRYLDEDPPDADAPSNASQPIGRIASERITRAHGRVLKKGRRIEADSSAASFHRLRIECKKLRYLLEFFRSLYAAEDLEPSVKTLKRLQDNLGDLNDLQVHQSALTELAQGMLAHDAVSAGALLAVGRLAERLEQRQRAERARFRALFSKFARRECRARFARMLRPVGGVTS